MADTYKSTRVMADEKDEVRKLRNERIKKNKHSEAKSRPFSTDRSFSACKAVAASRPLLSLAPYDNNNCCNARQRRPRCSITVSEILSPFNPSASPLSTRHTDSQRFLSTNSGSDDATPLPTLLRPSHPLTKRPQHPTSLSAITAITNTADTWG